MCEGHHRHHHEHGRRGGRRRGFRGFPSRDQMVERLTGYREHLESELANVHELLERLSDAPGTGSADPAPETI